MISDFLFVLVDEPTATIDEIRLRMLMKMQSNCFKCSGQVVIVAVYVGKDRSGAAPHSAINNSRLTTVGLG